MSHSKKAKEPRPIRSRPSIFSVSPEIQKQCYDKERIILECIALREANGGRLPRDERAKAATELRVAGRMVNTLIDDYLAYCEAFPDQPSVNAFVPQRMGRPKSTRLIGEQAMVAVFAYLNPSWISIIEDGPVKDVKLTPTIELVYRLLLFLWPDIGISEDYLRKFLKKRRVRNEALFTLAREGENAFWKNFIMKKTNNVKGPNIRWQSDARPLPIYVRDGKIIYTVTLISIIDDYSRNVIKWMLLPRKVINEEDIVTKADFTELDARALLAGAMHTSGVRPWILYTDNGGQYKAWKDVLRFLTKPGEPPIEFIFSKPGRPEGRGKVEVFQKLVNSGILGSDGFIKEKSKEQWWEKYREIKRDPGKLHTIKDIRKALETFFRDDWNGKALRGHNKKTRRDVWLEGLSSSLPAPELEQYVAFGAASAWKPLTPSSSGIYYKEIYYQPTSEGGYNRLKNAVSKGIKVPFYILPFSEGDMARASFDEGHTWETVVPAEKYSVPTRKHGDLQEVELRDTKQELQEGLDELFSLLNERYGWDKPGFIMGSRVIVPGETIKEQKANQKVEAQAETKPKKSPGRKRGSQKNQPPVQEPATATIQSSTDNSEVNTDPKLSEDKARAFLERYNQRRATQARTDTNGEAGS